MRWRKSPGLQWGPHTINNSSLSFVVYYYQSAVNISVSSRLGAFLSSLAGEMEGKEREREEN